MTIRPLTITAEVLLFLGSGRFEVIANQLPLDAKVVNVAVRRNAYRDPDKDPGYEVILDVASNEFMIADDRRPLDAPVIKRI